MPSAAHDARKHTSATEEEIFRKSRRVESPFELARNTYLFRYAFRVRNADGEEDFARNARGFVTTLIAPPSAQDKQKREGKGREKNEMGEKFNHGDDLV